MKVFAAIFLALVAASVVAWWIQPKTIEDGRVLLTWATDDNPGRREQTALFNKRHADARVRIDPQNAGMEKVIVQSMAGVGPDLFDCYSPFQLSSYVQAGVAWDITDELSRAGVDVTSEVWKTVLPFCVYEGRVYGFPANAGVDAIWFNKDLFDRSQIPYPQSLWTWEELIAVTQRLTVRDDNGRPRQFGFSFAPWAWRFFLIKWGGRIYSADGTRCTVDSPEAIAAVQFIHDLIYRYKVMPSPADEENMAQQGGWGGSSIKFLGAGRVAMALGGRWWLSTLRNYPDLRLGAVAAPGDPSDRCLGYGRATLINKNSPHRTEALQFLLYMAGPDYNRLINRQADALAPVKRFCTDEYLFNHAYPNEDFHRVFRDVMPSGVPDVPSPFVSAALADRILEKQMDLVRRNAKTPAEAMRAAAAQINAEIQKALARDPSLRQRYEEAGKR